MFERKSYSCCRKTNKLLLFIWVMILYKIPVVQIQAYHVICVDYAITLFELLNYICYVKL